MGLLLVLYNDTAIKIDMSTINALCKYLKVGAGELFEYKDRFDSVGF